MCVYLLTYLFLYICMNLHFFLRMFMIVWWLMAMIISISYTGNLIAFVTVPGKPQRLKTLDELAGSDIM